ncbi:MFS transporter [Rhodococcus sp. IEGM 1379]|uniref:MFS transporter n=1 Tax=Rhodococcus sp. IEGM 1379 TaxID=3047086 RepID=UPI0024B7FA9E|nr:MFS transporter [Rhodococcus sp. IEGM 1379]MDI9916838.1 MFS transporter [Rhodococcus sp. IEGM 1379]
MSQSSMLEHSELPRVPQVRRWGYALLIMVLAAVNLRAGVTVVGPLVGLIEDDLGIGSVGVALLISLPLVCFGIFSPLVPRLCAGRSMEAVIAVALGVICLGAGVRSLNSDVALWCGTVALGAGIAVLNVVMPALLKRDFPDHVAVITGVYMSAQAMAAALSTSTAVPIAEATDAGWRLALGVWAIPPMVGIAVLAPRILRKRKSVSPRVGEANLVEPGWSPWTSARCWQVAVFMGAQSTVYYVILTSWPTLEVAAGIDRTTAGLHQGIMQVSSIVGLLLWSWVLRRMPRDQRILAWSASLTVVALGLVVVCPEQILIWNIVIGATTGGALVHALALFGLRTQNPAYAMEISSMAQSFGYFVAACGPLLAGFLLSATPSGRSVLAFIGVLLVIQIVAAHAASRPGLVGREISRKQPGNTTAVAFSGHVGDGEAS